MIQPTPVSECAALQMLRGLTLALIATVLRTRAGFGATLEIATRHTFNGEPIVLDSLRYQNAAGGDALKSSFLSVIENNPI